MQFFEIIVYGLSIFLIIATILPLFRVSHWSIRGFDFPRLQFAFLCGAVSIGHLFLFILDENFSLILTLGVLIVLTWQLWWIVPYTRLFSAEVAQSSEKLDKASIKIITANVLMSNRQAEKLIDLVHSHKPDVLVTLETDYWWQSQLEVLEASMPETVKVPLDNRYGIHLYSKLPLCNTEVRYLIEDSIPSIHTDIQLNENSTIQAHFLHPAPPSPTENSESTQRDAELILVARRTQLSKKPIIVTGDLNDVAWSSTTRLFRKISGLLDPRIGRGMFNTFHAKIPLMRWPLDHIFHSSHFTLKEIKRLESIDSDHFPLFTHLVLEGSGEQSDEGLEPDNDDKKRANRILKSHLER